MSKSLEPIGVAAIIVLTLLVGMLATWEEWERPQAQAIPTQSVPFLA